MGTLRSISSRGWRRTGSYHIALAMVCGLVLFVSLCISWSKQETSSSLNTFLISRCRCKDTGTLNTILHLILNIISTGILSSSNFFMQISLRNLPSLSKFKQVCWALLLCSTVPIHLLFNSAIFETKYEGQFWNLTIATEEFVHGGKYWLPGASLTPSGASSPSQDYSITNLTTNSPLPGSSTFNGTLEGYGDVFNLTDYWNATSNLKEIIRAISQVGATWDPLEAQQYYRAAKFCTNYKSLIIIVDTGTTEQRGWQRTDVYDFDPRTNLTRIWDTEMPPLEVNSLWSWASCQSHYHSSHYDRLPYDNGTFFHSCGRLFGMGSSWPSTTNIPNEVK
ncbi:hypothetical protein PG994_005877 [Apiospora phragmitis]|uniref:DUF6536 domain-containing protein n=1 Tax=Apiospora phragmitis TaxID=2905665 RepID=A0ABR1VG12_9PEZI